MEFLNRCICLVAITCFFPAVIGCREKTKTPDPANSVGAEKTPKPAAEPKPTVSATVTAEDLTAELTKTTFPSDVRKKYAGKVIVVTGTVREYDDIRRKIVLAGQTEQTSIECDLSKEGWLRGHFNKGDRIRVKGKCPKLGAEHPATQMSPHFRLEDCELIE
jgi:hypothetical protein